MEIKLLNKGYRQDKDLYKDFLEGKVDTNKDYFSDEVVEIEPIPNFPIYLTNSNIKEREVEYLKAFEVMEKYVIHQERDITFNGVFWHSFLVSENRDYIIQKYPQVKRSHKEFCNIVFKKFDWENYIYKCLLASQYICDHIDDEEERIFYYKMIPNNLDFYNYIIKHEITRNGELLIKLLDIVDELDLSKILKSPIKGRDDLGKDERYGRRVMFEFNKSYPILMTPMIDKEDLKIYFVEFLGKYYDVQEIKEKMKGTAVIV